MQTCKRCLTSKQETEFYNGDNSCKICRRKKVAEYRAANVDKIKEYDRNRPNRDERIEDTKNYYRERISTPEGRSKEWAKKKLYKEKNVIRRAAHAFVWNAIKYGKLKKQLCSVCGDQNAAAHHEDYTKPLEVVWLCTKHHGIRHREINQEIRDGVDWSDRGWLK